MKKTVDIEEKKTMGCECRNYDCDIEDTCNVRHKMRSAKEYSDLIKRLNRIEGQIRGIRKMVENNVYCTNILIQASAAGAAINSFNKELLSQHVRTCVAENIKSGNEEVVDELVTILQKLMK